MTKATPELNATFFNAVLGHDLAAVSDALDKGADVNHAEHESHLGLPALHIAAATGNVPMMTLLLDRGADIHLNAPYGFTVLHAAAGCDKPEAIEFLLSRGAKNSANDVKDFPIHLAAAEGNPQICAALAKLGDGLESCGMAGNTPIAEAARTGNVGALYEIQKAGACVNGAEGSRLSPLMAAAENGREESIKALVALGADMNEVDASGRTALHHAAIRQRGSAYRQLIELGANEGIVDHSGCMAIDLVSAPSREEFLRTERAAKNSQGQEKLSMQLVTAIASDQADQMVTLLDCGASLEGSELFSTMSVMHAAASANAAKCITRLINRAADPVAEVNQLTSSGNTPLHQAATSFAVDAALVLIQHGADVNAKHSPLTSTPLEFAMGRQQDPDTAARERMCLALIAHGATTWQAITPIEAAAKGGFNEKLVELLETTDFDRGSLIKLATDGGHADAADLIRANAARSLVSSQESSLMKAQRPG